MRAYFFAHTYLSSLQKGLQAAHCLAEIERRCKDIDIGVTHYLPWVHRHKTIIILSGGDCTVLNNLSDRLALSWPKMRIPWSYFNEDASLNFAITCVGAIVKEEVYSCPDPVGMLTAEEQWLHSEIWSRSLAQ